MDVHETLLPDTINDNPKLFVARDTHSIYLQPGTFVVDPYPPEAFPTMPCGQFDGPTFENDDPSLSQVPSDAAVLAKMIGGLMLGGLPGYIAVGIWSVLEAPYPGIPILGEGIGVVGSSPDTNAEPDVTPAPGTSEKWSVRWA